MRFSLLSLVALVPSVACIDTQLPPEPTTQAAVPYGQKIFLRDATIEERGDRCKLLGVEVVTASVTTASTAPETVGGQLVEDPTKAWNCYVEVTAGQLQVDVTEVTNAQFQLCVDSDACLKPDPAEVDKVTVCSSEDDFDLCPVVSVTQAEAARFCEFVGRRLPSGVESILMRQGNQPQTAEAVTDYPAGNMAPDNCDKAVLKTCGKPQPIALADKKGAASLDRTTQGIFDLTGNAAEWSADLIPSLRGNADGLPWFCTQRLPDENQPACPTGEACIMGRYKHPTSGVVGVYPVCITDPDLLFANGTIGSLFGGNYSTSTPEPARAGTFARSAREKPNAETNLGDAGFRCVDGSNAPTSLSAVLAP